MILTAYNTMACRSYITGDIRKKIELAAIENELVNLHSLHSKEIINGVYGIVPQNNDIPAFSHPIDITLKNFDDSDKPLMVIDTRPFFKVNKDGTFSTTNSAEYSFQLNRAILNSHWFESPSDLLNLGELPSVVFCRWLSTIITRRLGLTPGDQVKVTIVTLFYWYSLFNNSDSFDEKYKMRIITKASQLLNIPTTLSLPLVDNISHMSGVEDYCLTLRKVIESPRLESFSPALLFSLLGGSWFGNNVKEVIAVAIEHPVTFIAIIKAALDDRSYRKTTLGTLVYENDKRERGKDFNRNLFNLLRRYTR